MKSYVIQSISKDGFLPLTNDSLRVRKLGGWGGRVYFPKQWLHVHQAKNTSFISHFEFIFKMALNIIKHLRVFSWRSRHLNHMQIIWLNVGNVPIKTLSQIPESFPGTFRIMICLFTQPGKQWIHPCLVWVWTRIILKLDWQNQHASEGRLFRQLLSQGVENYNKLVLKSSNNYRLDCDI